MERKSQRGMRSSDTVAVKVEKEAEEVVKEEQERRGQKKRAARLNKKSNPDVHGKAVAVKVDKQGAGVKEKKEEEPLRKGQNNPDRSLPLPAMHGNIVDKKLIPEVHGKVFQVTVKTITGECCTIRVSEHLRISGLKRLIALQEGVPDEQLRLFFAGHELVDDATCSESGLCSECTIFIVLARGVRGNADADAVKVEEEEAAVVKDEQEESLGRGQKKRDRSLPLPATHERVVDKKVKPDLHGKEFQVTVAYIAGRSFTVIVSEHLPISGLKSLVELIDHVPVHEQLLFFSRRQLADDMTCGECGLFEGCKIICVRKLRGC